LGCWFGTEDFAQCQCRSGRQLPPDSLWIRGLQERHHAGRISEGLTNFEHVNPPARDVSIIRSLTCRSPQPPGTAYIRSLASFPTHSHSISSAGNDCNIPVTVPASC